MWIEKLAGGILQIDTSNGPQYLQPATFRQRAYLVWIFRNFHSLPALVLRPREQRLIDQLWSEQRSSPALSIRPRGRPIIGRIERRAAPIAELPLREPVTDPRPAAQEQSREVASA
jgi:hypothetical protein